MKLPVMLSIRGKQTYIGQEPDVIELVTEGTLEQLDNGWELCYEESALTGLEGVTTNFRIEPEQIVLTRTGKLNSQMIFREGEVHESLYQVEFGALLICVMASRIRFDITADGGTVDLVYAIEIDQQMAGYNLFQIQVRENNRTEAEVLQ